MDDHTFQKIEEDDSGVLGPQSILVCGFDLSIEEPLKKLLDNVGATAHRVVLCTPSMVKESLENALSKQSEEPPAEPGQLPKTMILSGLNGQQITSFLDSFKSSGIPRPIFAGVTPTNLKFPVGKLLKELLMEQKAMGR